MFSLELPHGGDSNENSQYTFFNLKKIKITQNYQFLQPGDFSKRLKNEFETAVFELLKFYYMLLQLLKIG